jgi:hypothetical protein
VKNVADDTNKNTIVAARKNKGYVLYSTKFYMKIKSIQIIISEILIIS